MEQQKQTTEKPVISTTLPPELHRQFLAFAASREWKPAQAMRYLVRTGLEKLAEERQADPLTAGREMAMTV